MKIALIGYGKMGHIIEQIALKRGHEIVSIIDIDNQADVHSDAFRSADVAIEFTTPHTAVGDIRAAWAAGLPVVCGTTGWHDMLPALKHEAQTEGKGLFWTSNFSIGVNVFMAANRLVARMLGGQEQYSVALSETHHIHKKDKPSGTAITLATDIIAQSRRYTAWRLTDDISDSATQLPITAYREGEVPGTHTIVFDSDQDTIRIEHTAKNRVGFARGAVMAAEFMAGKTGFYDMQHLLNSLL